MNRLFDVIERSEPTMAVVITEPMAEDVVEEVAKIADVVEFRADKFPTHELQYLAEEAKKLAALPLLLTVRLEAEGGNWSGTEEDRFQLISYLLPLVDGIDVEIGSTILPEVVRRVWDTDKVVIASNHNFVTTPTLDILEEILISGQDEGADFVKFATSVKTRNEYQRLAQFTLSHRDDNLIVVGMDDYGPLSRITFPALGSNLTYAFPSDAAVVAGQLNYLETHNFLKLYPDYPVA